MTLLKETLEVGDSQGGSQATARPKSDSGQLRADAVSLDVPVKVHGSRVVEVVRGTTSHTEPFEEQTSTMIVFPLGGVLKMTTQVAVGQAIVLTNLKNRQDAICRVVKVRTNPNLHSYVEVEFSHPQPGYWGVHFPSDGPEPPRKTAPAASVAPPAVPPAAPPKAAAPTVEAAKVEVPGGAAPKPAAPKPEVSVSVAPPAPPKAAAPVEASKPAPFVPAPLPAAAESDSFSLDQLRGDSGAALRPLSHAATEETHGSGESFAAKEPASHEGPALGRFAAAAGSTEHLPARPAFGASLEYGSSGLVEKEKSQGKNGARVAILVVVLAAAGAAGGFYYLRSRSATRLGAATAPALAQQPLPQQVPLAANPTPPNLPAAAPAQTPAPVQAALAPATAVAAPADDAPLAHPLDTRDRNELRSAKPAAPDATPGNASSSRPEAPKQNPAAPVPDMFGALNAHPTAAVHAAAGDAASAPSIGPGALAVGQGVALPSSEQAPANLAPPAPAAPEGPLPVGGQVKPPTLVRSSEVIYPEMARQAGVDGNVVVRVVIDTTGKVTEAKALSGPALLRDAAVKAMRQRRYAPSLLDGRPISVVMVVTLQFRR